MLKYDTRQHGIPHRIILGTRAAEGSCADDVLLSPIEARGLRNQDP